MGRRAHIDAETRSALDLKKVGVHVYTASPTTDVWCWGYKIDREPTQAWLPGMPAPADLLQHAASGGTIVAHNIGFDATLWNTVMRERFGWPPLRVKQIDCTMARASALALPADLETLAKVLQLDKQKDTEGGRLMKRMMRPRGVSDELGFRWWDQPERLQRLIAYCMDDVDAEAAVDDVLPPLDAKERALWELDFEINQYGAAVDCRLVQRLMDLAEHETEVLNAELRALTGGKVRSFSQIPDIKKFLALHNVHAASMDKASILEMLERKDLPDVVRRVLKIRQSAGRTSLKKLPRMLETAGADGRIRGMFRFHGASTGRWAGNGVQPQNLPRASFAKDDDESDAICAELVTVAKADAPLSMLSEMFKGVFGSPLDAAPMLLRSCFVAGDGKTLVGADFANIEGRVLAWMAGEAWKLQAFREYDNGTGPDLYRLAYSRSFGITPAQVDGKQRQIGKVMELALGYGGGYGAFGSMAKNYGVEVLQDGEVSANPDALAFDKVHEIKNAWRDAHPNITAFWRALEHAAMSAVLNPGKVFTAGPIKYRVGRLHSGHDVLYCRLPSGRCIAYFTPTVERRMKFGKMRPTLLYWGMKQVDGGARIWTQLQAYGGLLAENVTQSVARDILSDTMLYRATVAGNRDVRIALHVHDELVCEADEDDDEALPRLERACRVVPDWATGLPLAVKGWTGKHYSK